MTNEQLQLLLLGWLAELDAAIDGAREAMPGAAERETLDQWVKRPEYADRLVWIETNTTHEWRTVPGEYLALVPLVALRDAWQERVDMLGNGEVT